MSQTPSFELALGIGVSLTQHEHFHKEDAKSSSIRRMTIQIHSHVGESINAPCLRLRFKSNEVALPGNVRLAEDGTTLSILLQNPLTFAFAVF